MESIFAIAEQCTGSSPSRWNVVPDLEQLLTPPFQPHRLIAGGHLQTVLSLRTVIRRPLNPTLHWVQLPDGDRLAMHDDLPADWRAGDPSLMIVHGLCGCSLSPYMLRFASQFNGRGVRVFRLNLRGCGAGEGSANQITHAGRSDDIIAALATVAELTQAGPIGAVGISLGGNQLLRGFGLIGQQQSADGEAANVPDWLPRIHRIAAISPPINLQLCSDNMERRLLRPYNRYFIRHLLDRVPAAIQHQEPIAGALTNPPKTMRQLDDRVTAPLGGFGDAIDYYGRTAANKVIAHIQVPTLILAAADDPIVPVACFDAAARSNWPDSLRLVITRGGGHVGFIGRGSQRHWMDGLIERWFDL